MARKKKSSKNPNGAGSVYWNDAQQRFVGALSIPGGPRRYVYGPKDDASKTAELAVTEKLNGLRKRRPKAEGRRALGDFIDEWLEHADIRNATRANYRWAFKDYIEPYPIARQRLDDIERVDVRDHLNGLKPPPPRITKTGKILPRPQTVGVHTKRRVRVLLHRIFEEAVNLEVVDRNPVDRVPAPKIRRTRMVVWEPDEALHFLRAARESPLYAMYLLAITSTMGPAELWGLQKGDIHLKGGYLWVVQNLEDVDGHIRLDETKNENRRRRIDLPRMVVEALREHLKANMDKGPFVFTSPEGHPLRRQNFYRREWRPLLAKAAKSAEDAARSAGRTEYAFPRIRPYDLRHTCNALMAYLGVQIQVARERMGHSSIKTTDDVYGHLYESMQRDVADKFDRFLEAL